MIKWLFLKYLRDSTNPATPVQVSAQALLSSTVSDANLVTDWLYYGKIISVDSGIPRWMHLIICISGSFSWLCLSTDGRMLNLLREMILCIRIAIFGFILAFLRTVLLVLYIIQTCWCDGNALYNRPESIVNWIDEYAFRPLFQRLSNKRSFSSGSIVFLGIFAEDLPQLIISFQIEIEMHRMKAFDDLSPGAILNLMFTILDILHKIAEAYDTKNDLINRRYYVQRTIRASNNKLKHLEVTSSANQKIISIPNKYKTAKIYDPNTGKCVQKLKCEEPYHINDVAVMDDDTSNIIIACNDKRLRTFELSTGVLKSTKKLNFQPFFVSLSPNGNSIFTGGYQTYTKRYDDLEANGECSFTYEWTTTALDFIDNESFVSFQKCYNVIKIGNVDSKKTDSVTSH